MYIYIYIYIFIYVYIHIYFALYKINLRRPAVMLFQSSPAQLRSNERTYIYI